MRVNKVVNHDGTLTRVDIEIESTEFEQFVRELDDAVTHINSRVDIEIESTEFEQFVRELDDAVTRINYVPVLFDLANRAKKVYQSL